MYKLKWPDVNLLEAYYADYSPKVKSRIKEWLDGKTWPIDFGTKHKAKYIIGIAKNSTSDVYDFLKGLYYDDEKLKALLIGPPECHINLIKEIIGKSTKHIEKASKTKLGKPKPDIIVEDFHFICDKIFVEDLYENVLDKEKFVSELGLEICPYCGEQTIRVHRKPDGTVIKPHLDHFLPKSKYPFLAMSFFNLIPSCVRCNLAPNKGSKDPYCADRDLFRLMHPYEFDNAKFIFDYSYNFDGELNEDNFDVTIDYMDNGHLREGYTDIMAIEALYGGEKVAVKDLWSSIRDANDNKKKFNSQLVGEEIPDDWFTSPKAVLRYDFSEENSRTHQKYKFYKDLYLKMKQDLLE